MIRGFEKETITVRLRLGDRERLEALMSTSGLKRARIINEAISEYLNKKGV